jgi:pimeloyl-ACP methyl ester carboxylesterase
VTEIDLELGDDRKLHVYDTATLGDVRLSLFWHHGTPNIGAPPVPLFSASTRLGIRWVSYDRPGYGGSTSCPGRDVASAATYVARVADPLGIDRFAVMSHSGGGPHALACGALLPKRVRGVVSIAGLARSVPKGSTGSRAWRTQSHTPMITSNICAPRLAASVWTGNVKTAM